MIKTPFKTLIATAFITSSLLTAPLTAAEISTHGNWKAYVHNKDGEKVCYMASEPSSAKGNYKKRGDIFAFITHRPAKESKNVFSYMAGYSYKPDSEVTLTIDGQTFTLFPYGNMAWAPDADTDNRLAAAIQKGNKMIVKGRSSRGTLTTDTYSLKGSGAAYKAIGKHCKLN